MFKAITLMKRRAGLSMEELIDGYETIHSKLGERVLDGIARRYIRRYLRPLPSSRPAAEREPDADIVMEMWYDSREDYERFLSAVIEYRSEITEDELRWFDPASIRTFEVEEHESILATPEAHAR